MWKVVGGVGAGGGNGVGLCSILVGEISCGYMLTAKNMRRGKMFVENVFEECLTFFQKVDKVSSLEYWFWEKRHNKRHNKNNKQ